MKLAIVGTGLMGSSAGLAARRAGYRVVGWDADPAASLESLRIGALGEIAGEAGEALADADAVLVALPVPATLRFLREFDRAPRAQLVMDVASVKVPVALAGADVANFVATHPMTGSERSGPGAARADLFEGRTWAYGPPGDDALEARARDFIAALGGRPVAIDPERHDATVALTSHLPQVLASSLGALLMERLGDPAVCELTGPGMRSMLRLAASPWPLWAGILAANGPKVAQEVRNLVGILRSVADALESGNEQAVAQTFARGAAAVAAITANEPSPASVISGTPTETDEPR